MVLTQRAAARATRSRRVHPWYVLMEISGAQGRRHRRPPADRNPGSGSERGLITDARRRQLARPGATTSGACAKAVSEAQKPEGGNIKNDVSVPIAKIPEFIARADAAVLSASAPARARCRSATSATATCTTTSPSPSACRRPTSWRTGTRSSAPCTRPCSHFGGSISAEHGIGQMKREELASQERRRHGPDAPHQGRARPQGHPQSGQGAVMQGRHPGEGRDPCTLPHFR